MYQLVLRKFSTVIKSGCPVMAPSLVVVKAPQAFANITASFMFLLS